MKIRLLSLLMLLVATACSEWNTDHLGQYFQPANSLVRNFTQLVYVEYTGTGAEVYGPASHLVNATVDGLHVSISAEAEGLALFVYGYPASHDQESPTDGSLTIHSSLPYALYLNGLSLRSQGDLAIRSEGAGDCYVVLPAKSKNQLWGSLEVQSNLILTGTGALTISSNGPCIQSASLQCQYDVDVTLSSAQADGINITQRSMKTLLGKWDITADRYGIYCPDTIYLIGGTFRGSIQHGSYFETPGGAMICQADILAFSTFGSSVLDSALVAQRFDSIEVQASWQTNLTELSIEADSTYSLYRNDEEKAFAQVKARHTIDGPNLLISNAKILSTDSISVRH